MIDHEPFVWELLQPGARSPELSRELHAELKSCLHRAQLPVYVVTAVTAFVVYVAPFVLLEEPIQATLAADLGGRAGVAMALLFGISTLVVSPLFGFLAYARRESRALLEAGRRFPAHAMGSSDRPTRLRLMTTSGRIEMTLERFDPSLGREVTVFANPEESDAAAVILQHGGRSRIRLGRLQRVA